MLGDEDVPCDVEDEGVEVAGVKGKSVIIVETIDLDVSQTHFIVGKDDVRVD